MVKITGIEKGSRAEKVGIRSGDSLISINGNEICDVLDYRFYLAERQVELLLLGEGGEYSAIIKKGEYDDIGLLFETPLMDEKHSCKNKCIFCFIDQNPKGMRETIYFKDDDSRLSFLHGNYMTLTNMTDRDVERIVKMRFSPLNISVHTTNPELRVKMMKNKRSGEVLSYLDRFRDAGLSMCAQIVLCKGVNDGEELLRSMRDLAKYYPNLSSVSVVPAGLTKHRDGLYPLTDFSPEESGAVIDMIDSFAEQHKEKFGSRLFFAADEFYLKSGRDIPEADYYEDYPQLENGVGMIRSFLDEFEDAAVDIEELAESLTEPRHVAAATGYASYPTLKSMADAIMKITDKVKIDVYPIKNEFFGDSITVSGLLTGIDIFNALSGKLSCDELLIPASALRYPEMDFLCGMTLTELREKLGVKIRISENDGYCFLDAVFGRE
jgi:putative radical SAM enzyme (TIGR03279 family)